MENDIRMYLTVRTPDADAAGFQRLAEAVSNQRVQESLEILFGAKLDFVSADRIAFPSARWRFRAAEPAAVQPGAESPRVRSRSIEIDIPPALARLDEIVLVLYADAPRQREILVLVTERHPEWNLVLTADLPLGLADYWCPSPAYVSFGKREIARQLINADKLPTTGLVNVVLVDEGLDAGKLGASYGGGWDIFDPSQSPNPIKAGTTVGGHGEMVSRNVLGLAPGARLFDMPLVPRSRVPLQHWLSEAQTAFAAIRADVDWLVANHPAEYDQPWIISNSWSVFGRDEDVLSPFYASDPLHPMNRQVGRMVDAGHDTIFAAANCGPFCPDMRCGRADRGAGRSILGASGHARVITVGAIRVDGEWLGYSSEGPGLLTPIKPDLCAPASFHEDHDAAMDNGGTSAACAVVAGVVAAVRTLHSSAQLPPDQLHLALVGSARPLVGQTGFSPRLGHGVIDADRLLNWL